ncbi:MFS transporter (plasmid) [Marinobacter sp. M3C]|jgi:predicted MFS family arabinose efflux permease|uniref:MFS transporter n=1 Tax=Marinobacter sp. M3C TaxID=2917715 RepID=UPI00200C9FD6|nr:MFS transporter [Marinobacter sp. M3C]UQG62656.1 MFS transporter [Marinobacter sp. M3C]
MNSTADDGRLVLVATTWVQTMSSAAMLLVPTLAPQIAATFGISTGLVGLQISLLYGVAMLSSMQAGALTRRVGACRASQFAMALVSGACMIALAGTSTALLSATVLFGIAYGLTNPAAAQLLARFTLSRNRNMVYSIKQSGVPLGGILVGIAAPPLAQAWSWHAAFLVLGVTTLATSLALQFRRRFWDNDRDPDARLQGMGSLKVLYRRPPILWLGLGGLFLAAAQLSLLSFAIAFMVEELLIALVTAGIIMSVVHAAGVFGRIGWGLLADRVGRSVPVLYCLALAMAGLFTSIALLGTSMPQWLVIVLLVAAGLTAIGWNGVYLAEVARRSPQPEVGEATAAVLVLTYMGVLCGPALFSLIVGLSGSYAIGFLLPAVAAVLATFCLLACTRVSEMAVNQSMSRRSP